MNPSLFYLNFRCRDIIIGFLILYRVESEKTLIRSSEYINHVYIYIYKLGDIYFVFKMVS